MPRALSQLLRQAGSSQVLINRLLPVCGSIRSAQNELRWLDERAQGVALNCSNRRSHGSLLEEFVTRRAQHEPLQYILGSEYFGELEIKCRPGVLIPRQETASAVSHLASLLAGPGLLPPRLRIVDFCTGTGCIPLLLHHELSSQVDNNRTELELYGIDISPSAIDLAQENKRLQLDSRARDVAPGHQSLERMRFELADLFRDGDISSHSEMDVLISNPPYISPADFETKTEKSVRDFEPTLALVPTKTDARGVVTGDEFYPRLLHVAQQCGARIVLMEVGDGAQAERVCQLAISQEVWDVIEVWKDEPSASCGNEQESASTPDARRIRVKGRGKARSVFAVRGEGRGWVGLA
ncbi:modification methylase HemK [Polychaeton citri CBS 116435]|uniref:Modification methylase HemK n=1 Tax=Polychaeton citri CBS 116435 TaxID=1314669 RepID=A0A9P4QA62_9PEZI|nr:modification methylase HemK [Polychaeton citri CBS 116435]